MDTEKPELSAAQAFEQLEKRRIGEKVQETAALAFSLTPVIGGAIQTVLGGQLSERRAEWVTSTLKALVREAQQLEKKVNTQFVEAGDFEDLLFEAMPRVAKERSAQKRQAYKNILLGALTTEYYQTYDRAIKFMQTLEQMQDAHFEVLRALNIRSAADPDSDYRASKSVQETLQLRVREPLWSDIRALLEDLDDLRLTKGAAEKINITVSNYGGNNLMHYLTPYGEAFIRYVLKT